MKKVLIITYFFPPCELTASNRAFFWAKHLKDYGYDPIVITRKWDHKIKSPKDIAYSSIDEKKLIEIKPSYSVIYMPYKGSLRDKIYVKKPKWTLLRKMLTLVELFGSNFSTKVLPYYNIYEEAKLIIEEKNITTVLITGNPFPCFQFGYLLKKKFQNLNWIADYRDDWTTTELYFPKGVVEKILFKLEQKSEKKWLSNAVFFTTISNYYVKKISKLTGLQGFELINGFEDGLNHYTSPKLDKSRFEITYNGTLYSSQKIEPFLIAAKHTINRFVNQIHIHLNFPGLLFDLAQAKRVELVLKGYEEHYTITDRIEREEVIKIQQKSNVLLMIAHEGLKGIPSSKLYEYIGLNKPVFLYPNDNDIIEKTLKDCGLGIICEDETDIENKLSKFITDFILNSKSSFFGDGKKIEKYQRKEQVKKLATLLDKL